MNRPKPPLQPKPAKALLAQEKQRPYRKLPAGAWLPGPPAYPDGTPIAQEAIATLPEDGYLYEWWNGVLHVTPSPTTAHQGCLGNFYTFLNFYLISVGAGKAFQDLDINIP